MQARPAGEDDVVGVPRVGRPERVGQPGQAAVEPVGAQVGERGRGGGALRQVRRRQPPAQALVRRGGGRVGRPRRGRPLLQRQSVRDQPGEIGGDRLRVSGAAEHAVHAAGRDRGEEVLEVESQHDATPGVPAGVGERRMPAPEAVGGVVRRDRLEDPAQHTPLGLLEQALGLLDQPRRRRRAGAASGSDSCAAGGRRRAAPGRGGRRATRARRGAGRASRRGRPACRARARASASAPSPARRSPPAHAAAAVASRPCGRRAGRAPARSRPRARAGDRPGGRGTPSRPRQRRLRASAAVAQAPPPRASAMPAGSQSPSRNAAAVAPATRARCVRPHSVMQCRPTTRPDCSCPACAGLRRRRSEAHAMRCVVTPVPLGVPQRDPPSGSTRDASSDGRTIPQGSRG